MLPVSALFSVSDDIRFGRRTGNNLRKPGLTLSIIWVRAHVKLVGEPEIL
jgi:hypothetical protein